MNFTVQHLEQMIPSNKAAAAKWHAAMMEIFPKYDINTPERIAGFVAQCAHESGDFRTLEENLNYSEKALNSVFGRYFGAGKRNAAEYARNPEKIANYVYMDEFRSKQGALGNTQPGDGWKFRGRGLKQLTGRNNYGAFGKSVGMTADEAAEYVATEKGAIESACWFWNAKKLNAVADAGDVVRMTKIINGGDIGLADRQQRYANAIAVMGGKAPAPSAAPAPTRGPTTPGSIIKVGARGGTVRKIQEVLGIPADGVFGPGTERAVKAWQAKKGLTPDGIVGKATLAKMGIQ